MIAQDSVEPCFSFNDINSVQLLTRLREKWIGEENMAKVLTKLHKRSEQRCQWLLYSWHCFVLGFSIIASGVAEAAAHPCHWGDPSNESGNNRQWLAVTVPSSTRRSSLGFAPSQRKNWSIDGLCGLCERERGLQNLMVGRFHLECFEFPFRSGSILTGNAYYRIGKRVYIAVLIIITFPTYSCEKLW